MSGSDWGLQLQNGISNADQAVGAGREFWAIQSTEAFYQEFVDEKGLYPDGVAKCYTTIQAAIDACVANRGDVVNVIGEWTSEVTVTLNKWGTTLRGATDWNSITGGGNANITCTGAGIATLTVTKAKCHVENLVLYFNGTGVTKGIEFASSAPSQAVVRNVECVKNGGDNAAGYGIKFTTVPTRGEFSSIKITGSANNALVMAYGIQGGEYSCVFRDIVVSNATVGINLDTYGGLFQRVIVAGTCVTGMDIYGAAAAQSMMVDCRNMGASKGTLTNMVFSGSYATGLVELTA